MIIGNGMLARAFEDLYKNDDSHIVFASGVSNSNEKLDKNFKREEMLLINTLSESKGKTIIYFSTCSVYDSSLANSLYIYHKLHMERIIREKATSYMIIRLPQVIGITSSPTIVNFIFNKINNGEKFSIFNRTVRNFVDVEDISKIVNYLIKNRLFLNNIINLASTQYTSIYQVVLYLEKIIGKRAVYDIEDKGSKYFIDVSNLLDIYKELDIKFNEHYMEKVINKYYAIK